MAWWRMVWKTSLLLATLPPVVLSAGLSGAPAGHYESYVFAMEWQPKWSLAACPGERYADPAVVRAMALPGAYARANLSLHGLWPNYDPAAHDGFTWPQFCNSTAGDYEECQRDADLPLCRPTAQARLEFNRTDQWGRWALQYAHGTLAAHEWAKHGSCTPWSAAALGEEVQLHYWRLQAEILAQLVGTGAGSALLRSAVGASVEADALRAAFAADAGGSVDHVALVCASGCALEQVWLGLAADAATLAPRYSPWVGHQISGDTCTACAAVNVEAWTGCPPPSPPRPPRPPRPPPAPEVTRCVHGMRGPACPGGYNASTVNTPLDSCRALGDCVRCGHSTHEGVHYCTAACLGPCLPPPPLASPPPAVLPSAGWRWRWDWETRWGWRWLGWRASWGWGWGAPGWAWVWA